MYRFYDINLNSSIHSMNQLIPAFHGRCGVWMSLHSTAAWESPSVMAPTSWPSIGWRTWGADGAGSGGHVNETSNDVHGEWLWMSNRDSWWADGLQWKRGLKSWMTGMTWSWAALISHFFGQECSPQRTTWVCQKGTLVRKCRCYILCMKCDQRNLSVHMSQPWKRWRSFVLALKPPKNLRCLARMQVQPFSHKGELEGIFEVPSSGSAATAVADSGVNSHVGCLKSPVSAFNGWCRRASVAQH